MSEPVHCDYLVDDKGLFCIPQFQPLMADDTVKALRRAINRHRQGFLHPVLKKHEDSIDRLISFLNEIEQLPALKRYSWLDQRYYGGFCQLHFASKSPEPLLLIRNPQYVATQKEWDIERLAQLGDVYPEMEKLVAKLTQKLEKSDGKSYQFTWGAIRNAAKIKQHLDEGKWKVDGGEQKAQAKAYEGLGICVYSNAMDKYYDGREWTVSITGARMYESLEAAKRSIKASRWASGNFSYIQAGVIFTDVLASDGPRSVKLEAHVSRAVKTDLEMHVAKHFENQPHPASSPKRKM